MAYQRHQSPRRRSGPAGWRQVMGIAAAQHGVITRAQLIELGFSAEAIKHRLVRGKLHPVHRGVYVVGRPELSRDGALMAALLACGRGAVASHTSAAALWEIAPFKGLIEVSIPLPRTVRRPGIHVHRRDALGPPPVTGQRVNGFKVDFYWPELGLVVETDGLRYHRTPQQQARDARRDQIHTAAGLTPLRFTHAQIAYEAGSSRPFSDARRADCRAIDAVG